MTRHGYSDVLFLGLHLKKKTLYRAWMQQRPGVDTETARRGYSDDLDIQRNIEHFRSCNAN